MFKYGLKIWSVNKQWFGGAASLFERGIIDFVEIYLVPDSFSLSDFEIFRQNNIPIIIHAPHTSHDFDVFSLNEKNLAVWQSQVLPVADFLASRFIIIHAGVGDSKKIFQQESAKIKDPRLLIESMSYKGSVGSNKVICFGYTKDQLEFIHQECGFDICFDVCHAIAAAASLKMSPYDYISDLLKISRPRYFHLAGGWIGDEHERHLDISDGDFDFHWLKKELVTLASQQDIFLVFETPKKGTDLKNDIENITNFKEI